MTSDSLRALVASAAYADTLSRVRRMIALSIEDAVPEAALSLDAKKIEAAGIPVDRLAELLVSDRERFAWFVALKLKKYAGAVIDDDSPYGFEVLDAPRLRYPADVLVSHLVEYALLRDAPDALDPYLKTQRIPGAKKYARELAIIVERADHRLEPAFR